MAKPITLTGPDVIATLAGLKTRHTVPVWPQPPEHLWRRRFAALKPGSNLWLAWAYAGGASACRSEDTIRCPFGAVGDTLWVRETWVDTAFGPFYRADNPTPYETDGPWRSPVTMPRWASRITLDLTSVDARRLQTITEEGARAHGGPGMQAIGCPGLTYRNVLANAWDRRHPKSPWASDPWCWCLEWKIKEVRR